MLLGSLDGRDTVADALPGGGRQALAPPAPAGACRPGVSRRGFLRLAGTTALGAALTACGLIRPAPRPAGKVELVYQDARAEGYPAMVREMLEEFHATHPNIRVFYIPEPEGPQTVEQSMLTAMQAGTAPDVFQGCCSWFPIWAQKGYTLDLRPYVRADLDVATIHDWDSAQYRCFFTHDGRQYGLPKYRGALALYYNKDLFDQCGVNYPNGDWNHEDYRAAMMRLTHDRDGDGRTDLWGSMFDLSWDRIQVHVNGWGGHFVDPDDPTHCLMARPEAMAAMEWLRARIWDDKVMATTLDVQKQWSRDAFAAGQIAMVEEGSWSLKFILTNASFRVGVAPFPEGAVRRVTLATSDGFGIYSGTKHPDAAWELVKFLTGKQFGRAMIRASLLQPARVSLVDEWVAAIRQKFPEKASDTDIAAFAEGHIRRNSATGEVAASTRSQITRYSVTGEAAANMAEATRIAYAAWDRIFTLGQAPVTLMAAVCREIEEAQKKAQSGAQGGLCC